MGEVEKERFRLVLLDELLGLGGEAGGVEADGVAVLWAFLSFIGLRPEHPIDDLAIFTDRDASLGVVGMVVVGDRDHMGPVEALGIGHHLIGGAQVPFADNPGGVTLRTQQLRNRDFVRVQADIHRWSEHRENAQAGVVAPGQQGGARG